MTSAASRVRERGEEGTHHHTTPNHRPDPEHLSCDSAGCGGGTAKSWPERGRFGDAEAASHRNHLRKGNFQPKLHLEHLEEKLKLLGLEGGGEEEQLCSWRKRTFAFGGDAKASGRGAPRARGGAHGEEPAQEDRVRPVVLLFGIFPYLKVVFFVHLRGCWSFLEHLGIAGFKPASFYSSFWLFLHCENK